MTLRPFPLRTVEDTAVYIIIYLFIYKKDLISSQIMIASITDEIAKYQITRLRDCVESNKNKCE